MKTIEEVTQIVLENQRKAMRKHLESLAWYGNPMLYRGETRPKPTASRVVYMPTENASEADYKLATMSLLNALPEVDFVEVGRCEDETP